MGRVVSDIAEDSTGFDRPDDLPVAFVAPAYGHAPVSLPPPTGEPVKLYGYGQPTSDPDWERLEPDTPLGWGLGAVLLGIPVILGTALVFGIFALAILLASGSTFDDAATSPWFLLPSLLGQQAGMGLWPIFVAKRWGAGPKHDLRVRFDQIGSDLKVGIGVGFGGFVTAVCVGLVVRVLLGLDDADAASNTQIVDDIVSRPALVLLVLLVVVGAPISEELFFRGMLQRATTSKWGPIVGGIVTTVAFTAIHFNGAGLKPTVALFATIGTVAVFFAILVHKTKSLLPAIVAHCLFNAIGITAALLAT